MNLTNLLKPGQILSELQPLRAHLEISDTLSFAPGFRWVSRFARGLPSAMPAAYQTETFDCEEFALTARLLATQALLKARLSFPCGHTFGIARLSIRNWNDWGDEVGGLNGIPPGPHVTNIVRTSDGPWLLVEPQTGYTTLLNSTTNFVSFHFVWI